MRTCDRFFGRGRLSAKGLAKRPASHRSFHAELVPHHKAERDAAAGLAGERTEVSPHVRRVKRTSPLGSRWAR